MNKKAVRLNFTDKQIQMIKKASLPFGEKTMAKKVMALLKDYFVIKHKLQK